MLTREARCQNSTILNNSDHETLHQLLNEDDTENDLSQEPVSEFLQPGGDAVPSTPSPSMDDRVVSY